MAQAKYSFYTGISADAQKRCKFNFIDITVRQPEKLDDHREKVEPSSGGNPEKVWDTQLIDETGVISMGFRETEDSSKYCPLDGSIYIKLTSSKPCEFNVERQEDKWVIKIKKIKASSGTEEPPEVNVTVGDDGEGG